MPVQLISLRLWNAQYYQKAHQSITVKISNITKPNDAAKTASRLNFRIRLWYSAAQPISPPLTEVPCAASTNPLAFTFYFLQGADTATTMPKKQIYRQSWRL